MTLWVRMSIINIGSMPIIMLASTSEEAKQERKYQKNKWIDKNITLQYRNKQVSHAYYIILMDHVSRQEQMALYCFNLRVIYLLALVKSKYVF